MELGDFFGFGALKGKRLWFPMVALVWVLHGIVVLQKTGILIIMLKYHEISQHCKTFCRGESLGPHSMLRESVGWELKCCRKIGGSLVPQVWTALLRLFLGKKNLGYLWNWNFMDIYGIDDHRCVFQDVKLMSISWATS